MGGVVERMTGSGEPNIDRIFARFQEHTPSNISTKETPQRVVGTTQGKGELIAPLSGRKCVYYMVEALELCERDNKIDWHNQFTEVRGLSFDITDGTNCIYVDIDADPSMICCLEDAVMEYHTGDEAFPAMELGDELEGNAADPPERVMVYSSPNAKQEDTGKVVEGLPQPFQQLLERNKFLLNVVPGNPKHKRMRFSEKCIDAGGKKVEFIGVVRTCDVSTPLGHRRLKMDVVCLLTYVRILSPFILLGERMCRTSRNPQEAMYLYKVNAIFSLSMPSCSTIFNFEHIGTSKCFNSTTCSNVFEKLGWAHTLCGKALIFNVQISNCMDSQCIRNDRSLNENR